MKDCIVYKPRSAALTLSFNIYSSLLAFNNFSLQRSKSFTKDFTLLSQLLFFFNYLRRLLGLSRFLTFLATTGIFRTLAFECSPIVRNSTTPLLARLQ